jgi:hypothetical protein
MGTPCDDLLASLATWPAGLEAALREGRAGRAAALAGQLRRVLLGCMRARCRLDGEEAVEPAGEEPAGEEMAAEFGDGVKPRGRLAVALGFGAGPEERASASAALALAAHSLGLRLQVEALAEERAECADLVTVGEAMTGLVHLVNNVLNTIVLQAATLQLRLDPALRHEVGVIRREGAQLAHRLAPLQQVRAVPRRPDVRADLNDTVRAALAVAPHLAARVRPQLAPDVPPVPAPPLSLRRLVLGLLRVALESHMPADRPLGLRTGCVKGGAQLVLEVEGPRLEAEGLDALTDLPVDGGPGIGLVERIAAQSLARRLGGQVRVAPRAEGGVAIAVTWGGRQDG